MFRLYAVEQRRVSSTNSPTRRHHAILCSSWTVSGRRAPEVDNAVTKGIILFDAMIQQNARADENVVMLEFSLQNGRSRGVGESSRGLYSPVIYRAGIGAPQECYHAPKENRVGLI